MTERLNVREFRAMFSRLTEPVEVLRGTETIGFWYPGAVPPFVKGIVADDGYDLIPGKMPSEVKVEPGSAPRSTSMPKIDPPAQQPRGFGMSRPAPKPGTRK